jgi:hypothetical protein
MKYLCNEMNTITHYTWYMQLIPIMGIVCSIRVKRGCLHAFNMIQLHHSHPPQQGHQWTQFSNITHSNRTMHLPAQPGQDGLSHSELHEFVLVPATPTRTMLLPRKFSHNIEHVDRASTSQLVATPVGCQGSPETNPEHFKNGFNKTNPYLDMKEGQKSKKHSSPAEVWPHQSCPTYPGHTC